MSIPIFKVIGAILAAYVCYAVVSGGVYAKSGPFARKVLREETPRYFWVVIAIYAGLCLALILYF